MDVDCVGVDVGNINVIEHLYGPGEALGFQAIPDPFHVQCNTVTADSPSCQPLTPPGTSGDRVSAVSSSSTLSRVHVICSPQRVDHCLLPSGNVCARPLRR